MLLHEDKLIICNDMLVKVVLPPEGVPSRGLSAACKYADMLPAVLRGKVG